MTGRCGVLSALLIPIQISGVFWVAIAVYGLGYAVLGFALFTEPSPKDERAIQIA